MKINIYYGGRGVINDPTIYVLERIQDALIDLKSEVTYYNIYEQKNSIPTLANTLSDVDGIILATTVEWMGIGGYMAQFLDALWFYANKEEIANIYMMPVVISTTHGERESLLALENAWELLGGLPCSGLCGYVEDLSEFESNGEYRKEIGKKAEDMYRTISKRIKGLPNSNKAVSRTVLKTQQLALSPKESEQLSKYASSEEYVEKQKQDIKDLSSIYRSRLGDIDDDPETEFINSLKSHFKPIDDFSASYLFDIEGKKTPLYMMINGEEFECEYKDVESTDILAKLTADTMNNIVSGRVTFLGAFAEGDMTARGQFFVLRKLDEVFEF